MKDSLFIADPGKRHMFPIMREISR